MTDLNNVVVMGRLTYDVEQNGKAYKLSVAVNRSYKVNEEWKDDVSYFDVTCWKLSENQLNKLCKGTKVTVVGSLKQDRWEKDGQKFSKVGILAEKIFIEKSGANANKEVSSDDTPGDDEIMF